MSWILKFRRKAAVPGEGALYIRVECAEDGLQSEKEDCAMTLEQNSGDRKFAHGANSTSSPEANLGAWVCEDVQIFVPVKRGQDHDD